MSWKVWMVMILRRILALRRYALLFLLYVLIMSIGFKNLHYISGNWSNVLYTAHALGPCGSHFVVE